MADRDQRTERATPRRIDKARREGQFPVSREFVGSVQFAVFVAMLGAWGAAWMARNNRLTAWLLRRAFTEDLKAGDVLALFHVVLREALGPLAAAGAALVLAGLAVHLATTKLGFSLKRLAPDARRFSPSARLRDQFRQNVSGFLKALVMLPLFVAAVWVTAEDQLAAYVALPLADVAAGASTVARSIQGLLWKATGGFLVLGAVDLVRQRRRYFQDLRMTKHEVREEAKELEGNPQMKGRVRRLQRELLRRRMIRQVPSATAVVVNPAHYAVALRYRMESMGAPVVVAKGKNYLARRIRELAVENHIPVVENAPLAQALYKAVEVGQEIPAQFYRAVAEILAYIHRLMRGRLPGA